MDIGTFLFGFIIVYGVYVAFIEPIIGGGKHRSSHYSDRDHYRR